MMLALRLFYEYFIMGALAVGGGLATIPFLTELSARTGWFTLEELANMVAVAESSPGPIGVNVASYVGFKLMGVPGAVIATLGLITPCFIAILIISKVLDKYKENKYVQHAFAGIRPASVGLIANALISLCSLSFVFGGGKLVIALCLAAALFVLSNFVPKVKKMHPIVFVLIGAIVGMVFL